MWELNHKESRAPKNWYFELWCWRILLRVPWLARRSNQSTLKEISPKYSLEGLMLKLKLQYFGHLMGRIYSMENTLMLGKIEGRRWRERHFMQRGWDGWMVSRIQWTWVWASSQSWWWTGRPCVLPSSGSAKRWTRLSDWLLVLGLAKVWKEWLLHCFMEITRNSWDAWKGWESRD